MIVSWVKLLRISSEKLFAQLGESVCLWRLLSFSRCVWMCSRCCDFEVNLIIAIKAITILVTLVFEIEIIYRAAWFSSLAFFRFHFQFDQGVCSIHSICEGNGMYGFIWLRLTETLGILLWMFRWRMNTGKVSKWYGAGCSLKSCEKQMFRKKNVEYVERCERVALFRCIDKSPDVF